MDAFCLIVVAGTLIGVALGRYPSLRMNRATISLVGATLLVCAGALNLDQAYRSIDLNTLALLLAMMIINANLRISGFFQLISAWVGRHAGSPRGLLAFVVFSSGVLSALLLNDTIVLVFTPLILDIVRSCRRNPIPYLIGLATSANIGSAATIIGNPQNMLIGIASGLPFLEFSKHLLPASLMGLSVTVILLYLLYPKEFRRGVRLTLQDAPVRPYHPLMRKTLASIGLMLVAFMAGVDVTLGALAAAALLLITRRLKPERVFREIDWSLLIFFSGLFVVTGSLEVRGYSQALFSQVSHLAEGGVGPLAAVSVILSNLVSNVPAVLLFRPLVPRLPNPEQAWLTLAMATTFAGNLTLLGSVANLIVAETAGRLGVPLSFAEFLKGGVPITLTSLVLGALWLSLMS